MQLYRASIPNLAKSILRPAHTPFRQCPSPLSQILTRSTSPNVNRQQMLERRMGLPRIWALQQIRHRLLPLVRSSCYSLLERLVETNGVWQRLVTTKCESQIPQVVHRHARYDDQNVFLAQSSNCLAQSVVLVWVLSVEQRDLYDRYI